MLKTDAKYHHLIPKTYMKAWYHLDEKVYVVYADDLSKVNTECTSEFAGIQHYHTLRAGSPVLKESDCAELFSCLDGLNIGHESNLLSTPLELNNFYYDFDSWIITNKDGINTDMESIKKYIDGKLHRDIEVLWNHKYENRWNSARCEIKTNILSADSNEIPAFNKDYLIRFFVSIDWRGYKSNDEFNYIYDSLPLEMLDALIPEGKRKYEFCETYNEELKHEVKLKQFYDYLRDTGNMHQQANQHIENLTLCFLIANETNEFITSDNPAFFHTDSAGTRGIMAITPKILMLLVSNKDNIENYVIKKLNDQEVKQYNQIIANNSVSFVIIHDKEILKDFPLQSFSPCD